VRDDDALGVLVGHRERVHMVARGGELDQRHRGDARPALAIVPAPLYARVAGIDGENQASLVATMRPLWTACSPLRVSTRSAPSAARPPPMPQIERPFASRTRRRWPACASIASHSARAAPKPSASKRSSAARSERATAAI